jgi:hypothetical protein
MSKIKKCYSYSYLYNCESNEEKYKEIICLNVGGKRFCTSRQTLTSISDTFFTALLSGRISSLRDSSGAIFVDRDPKLFSIILNYMRTRQLFDIKDCNLDILKHESEFYGITPLVKRLELCEELVRKPTCGGDVLFQAHLKTHRSFRNSINNESNSEPNVNSLTEMSYNPVRQVVAHHNAIAVAHNHYVTCYRLKDTMGWQSIFESQPIDNVIDEIAFYYNCGVAPTLGPKLMLAIKEKTSLIRLWSITVSHYNNINSNNTENNSLNSSATNSSSNGTQNSIEIGRFHLNNCFINSMFFIGSQLGKL